MLTTQTQTLNDLYERALDLKGIKADYRQPAHDFTFLNDGTITAKAPEGALFAGNMVPAPFTDWAMNQAYSKLGNAYQKNGKKLNSLKSDHMEALRDVDPSLWALVMNAAVDRLPAKETWFLRTAADKVRAVLSGEYLQIDNEVIIGWLKEILDRDASVDTRLSRYSFVNVDNMNIDVMFSDIRTGASNNNDGWTIGVRIRNGEIGDWQGGCFAVARRNHCDNSISVDREGFSYKFRHAGHKTLELKKFMMKGTMLSLIPMAEKLVEAQIAAEEVELPNFAAVVGGLKYKHGWSDAFAGAVHAGSEGRESVAGLVNGITFAAHTKTTSPEEQVNAEFFAGKVLFDKNQSIAREAVHLFHSKEARKAYALAA
jgi:hypothetical protein